MINIRELITDPDFCQTLKITRYTTALINHRWVNTPHSLTLTGIAIAQDSNKDDVREDYDRESETLTVLTLTRLKSTGKDKATQGNYSADIVHYKGAQYIVRECQDLSEYGYCRSRAEKIEQNLM